MAKGQNEQKSSFDGAWESLTQLDDDQAAALALRCLGLRSFEDIGETLCVPPDVAEKLTAAGQENFQALMGLRRERS